MARLTEEVKEYIESNRLLSNRQLEAEIKEKFDLKVSHVAIGKYKQKVDTWITPEMRKQDIDLKTIFGILSRVTDLEQQVKALFENKQIEPVTDAIFEAPREREQQLNTSNDETFIRTILEAIPVKILREIYTKVHEGQSYRGNKEDTIQAILDSRNLKTE